MKKHRQISAPAVGGSSLLVIFAVLCLTVFALLSLSTVLAEKRLSDAAARGVTAYYAADLEAERIFAGIRSGKPIAGVQQRGNVYSYACAISEKQVLMVEIEKTESGWKVLRWQNVPITEENEAVLPVWNGA